MIRKKDSFFKDSFPIENEIIFIYRCKYCNLVIQCGIKINSYGGNIFEHECLSDEEFAIKTIIE